MTCPGMYLVRWVMGLAMLEVFMVPTVMMTVAVMMVVGWLMVTVAMFVITTGMLVLVTAAAADGDNGDDRHDCGLVDDGSSSHVWGQHRDAVLVICDGGSVHRPWW